MYIKFSVVTALQKGKKKIKAMIGKFHKSPRCDCSGCHGKKN